MKRSLIVLAVASLVFAGVASAEVRKGDVMLDFLGGWTQQNPAEGGIINVYFAAARPGYAVTDNIRLSAVGAAAHEEVKGSHTSVWALGASGEYVFMPANTLNPYVGGEVAWATAGTNGNSQDGWLLAPRVGVLVTLNRTNNLFAEYQYQFMMGGISKTLDNGQMILLGIEHKFKTGQ